MLKHKKFLISFLLIVFSFVSFADILACDDCMMLPQGSGGEHLCSICLNPINTVSSCSYNSIFISAKLNLELFHFSFLEPASPIDKPPQN